MTGARIKNRIRLILPIITCLISGSFAIAPSTVLAAGPAGLSLGPTTGSYVVESTFEVSIYLDTSGQSVNALQLNVKFPPDKLQLVSSSTGGRSIIGIWPSLPKFNNQNGTVELTGGIPNGAVVSKGLVSTLTFRAKTIGSAVVKIERAQVLSNDGSGTEIPVQLTNSIFQITLPPPAGPIIVSDTHPDQSVWYKEKNVSLSWGDEGGVEGFSYMMSDIPVDLPDDVSEGTARAIVYRNITEGRNYFHIKGLRNGQWGGVSHYSLNIDSVAPAEFEIEIIPRSRTTRRQPVIQFETTDASSGVDHYELKLIPLNNPESDINQRLFIEATSPYVSEELENGAYNVIVRAYDKANNYTENVVKLEIVPALLRNIGDDGLELRSTLVLPWIWVWILLGLVLAVLVYIAYLIKKHHDRLHHQVIVQPVIPDHLQEQLDELQRYRDKYGQVMLLLLAIGMSFIFAKPAIAQSPVLTPPLIKSINKNLSNDELLYAGGFTGIPKAEVILYLQNLESGETFQFNVQSNEQGEWFYSHNEFLHSGNYLFWGQTKVAQQLSPPTAQVLLAVDKKALEFGGSKISYPMLYLMIIIILFVILLLLLFYIWHHSRKIRFKRKLHLKHVQDAEASIKRGFAVLNRDLQAELTVLAQMDRGSLTEEQLKREQHLIEDLKNIEIHLSEEIWDLRRVD